jgi:hypothetical protein
MVFVGWQPRWFVLDNWILSYYDSQDDVCKGSKGSIKMAVCEIKGKWKCVIRGTGGLDSMLQTRKKAFLCRDFLIPFISFIIRGGI